MGKRIYRLAAKAAFEKECELLGKELSFVLIDRRVLLGVLKGIKDSAFCCRNQLGKDFKVELKDIKEVLYDTASKF